MRVTRRGNLLAGVALFLACSSVATYSAGQCSAQSYREARSAMTNRLLATGYSKTQTSFLMRNADRMTSALRADKLNDNAGPCGIDSARAHVLGCLDKQLFPLDSGASSPLDEEKQTEGFWGRKRLSVRELLFIGHFHSCLGAATEYLFRS
ncbi:hypothetical protein FJ934_05670 [Mesorhizobium sp. B2-4-12]|uniref:hypothetical protein n=1 Tax=unclassified Mesorhizobium TaxID=325217 RepID=UPI00112DA0C2|nr:MULTISPECIES: hypothetical protein [unclassified Mesorhizobium]TPK91124.1 hypothetical protein FJ548_05315 [Mesorhizobium sp. B2-4-17]TPK97727.1 hypothetical protein FJ934_05670 [Mesorhizobium sp. B2-4-12]